MTSFRTLRAPLLLAALGVALLSGGATGQSFMMPSASQPSAMSPVNPEAVDYSSFSRHTEQFPSEYNLQNLIDNSIDEDAYYVGGGDVFLISILDRSTKVILATINQSGDLYIPQMGIVPVGKKTLREARKIISEYFASQVKKAGEPYVTLYRVKTATVTMSGMVENPGSFQLPGTMRLWDVIRASNRDFREQNVRTLMYETDLRSVRRRNRDSVDYFDLLAFVYKNDLSQNPYIYPGDELLLSPITARVFVHGEISSPVAGWIPLRADDRADRFLSLFSFGSNADTSRITLNRRTFGANGSLTMERTVISAGSAMTLQNGDIISVPALQNIGEVMIATVEGEVVRPGTFSIVKARTTAKELIAMAGEATPYANMRKAVVIRRSRFNNASRAVLEGKIPDVGEPLGKVRPELGSALELMGTTKDFSVIRIDEHPDVVLESNDQVVVPRTENIVYLSGNVVRPGGYPFVKGKNKAYYIDRAGGLTEKADKSNIYLVAQYGEIRQVINRKVIEDGDVIVVPISHEYKKLTTIILPILGAAISTLGLLVGLYATLK